MNPATGRPQLERWLAGAAFNAYFGFRLREIGAGECKIGRQLVYAVAECARRDGTPLTHHTGIHVRIPDGRARGRDARFPGRSPRSPPRGRGAVG